MMVTPPPEVLVQAIPGDGGYCQLKKKKTVNSNQV